MPLSPPSSTSRYPPSFATLPRELLAHVAENLDDRASSLAFARVSRECTPHAEAGIFRDLDLFLPERYGQSPRILPYAIDHDGPRFIAWGEAEMAEMERTHRAGLRKKLKDIMMRLDERRLQMVETAVVVPISGTHAYMISLLGMISPHLQQLSIEAQPDYFCGSRLDPTWANRAHESFDLSVIGQDLTFPSLQHLHIGVNAARYVHFIYLLCCAATPVITSLYVSRHDRFSRPSRVPGSLQFPAFGPATSLKQIHISFGNVVGDGNLYTGTAQQLLILVLFSPELKQLSMDLAAGLPALRDLLQTISPGLERGSRLKKLEDLYWQDEAAQVHALFDGPEKPFTTLKRLVVLSDRWQDMFQLVPQLPNLEILFSKRDYKPPTPPPTSTGAITESTALAMTPSFAASLAYSPHLHAIHELTTFDEAASDELGIFAELDRIQQAGEYTGVIRSFRHGIADLFHARFSLSYRETSDVRPPLVDFDKNLQATLPYTAPDGSKRVKVFEKLSSPIYQDYTYFDGLCVPLEIIETMREVQGASEEGWWGRGIEVGAAAWAVLLEWKDRQTVEAAVDGSVEEEDEDDESGSAHE